MTGAFDVMGPRGGVTRTCISAHRARVFRIDRMRSWSSHRYSSMSSLGLQRKKVLAYCVFQFHAIRLLPYILSSRRNHTFAGKQPLVIVITNTSMLMHSPLPELKPDFPACYPRILKHIIQKNPFDRIRVRL